MKKLPAPAKPDVATYFLAKRMEGAGRLRPGQALMLAATLPPNPPVPRVTKKPQNCGKSATAKKGRK